MGRSKWKGIFINFEDLKNKNSYNIIKVTRNSQITPKFLDIFVFIYNGKNFIELKITENMIKHKFGEFSFTRKNFIYKKKVKKK
jgi:small subunit ribosomal protein S19